jgi:hypothetical protein
MTHLRHIGYTLLVAMIATLRWPTRRPRRKPTLVPKDTDPCSNNSTTIRFAPPAWEQAPCAQRAAIRSVLDPYNLPVSAYEAGKRSGLFVLDQAGKPTGAAFELYHDGNIDFTRPQP